MKEGEKEGRKEERKAKCIGNILHTNCLLNKRCGRKDRRIHVKKT